MRSPLVLVLLLAATVLSLASGASLAPSAAYPLYTDYTDLVSGRNNYVDPSQGAAFTGGRGGYPPSSQWLNFNNGYSNIAGSVSASYSICTWFLAAQSQNDGYPLTIVGAGPGNAGSFAIGLVDGGLLFAGQGDITKISTPYTQQTTYQITGFGFNQWYHTCHSYDSSTGASTLYFQGQLVANTTVPLPSDQWNGGSNSLTLGGLTYVSDPAQAASLQCLGIYSGVISSQQVNSIMSYQSQALCDSVLAFETTVQYQVPYSALSLATNYVNLVYPGTNLYSGPQQSAAFIPNAGRLSDGALVFSEGYSNIQGQIMPRYTICFWFQASAPQGSYPLTFVGANPTVSGSGGLAVGLIDGGLLFSGRGPSDSVPRAYPSQSTYQIPSFTLGQWYHVCTTYSQLTGVSTIYLNGQLVANDIAPLTAIQLRRQSTSFTLGGLQYESNPTVNAALQCVATWTTDISAEQVSVIYNNQVASSCNSGASFYFGPA